MSGAYALVVAAGRGHRIGGEIPKQYRDLGGAALLRRSVATLAAHAGIAGVRVVIHPDDRALYDAAVAGLAPLDPVEGGVKRQDSVRLGLESLAGLAPDYVLIHDAARPFVTAAIIDRTLRALETHAGALVAVQVVDTLKRQGKGKAGAVVADTVPRDGLWRAQTPQGFRFAEILAAHKKFAAEDHTDDAALAERAGLEVALVEGSEDNFKVTSEDDLRRAQAMVAPGETRTASGYDVHRFGSGDHVWLCGVKIAHDHGLIGHSDADAPLHALTDALLGTVGAGDIGSHFPPGEAQWKDASSDIFLKHAADLVRGRGGEVLHVDLTIICETPKIRPHHAAMVDRVAEILGIAAGRVSIKATTTERLGFTGRGEGLAAQALATVRLPG